MKTIKELILENNLVERGDDCSFKEWDDRLNLIEGGYLDLTLDSVLKPKDENFKAFLGKSTRLTPVQDEILPFKAKSGRPMWALHGGGYVFKTAETINLPNHFYTDLYTRRTVALDDVILSFAPIASGFSGKLFIKAWVNDNVIFEVEQGAAFCAIRFMPVSLDLTMYQGIWGGEKSHTNGYERAK